VLAFGNASRGTASAEISRSMRRTFDPCIPSSRHVLFPIETPAAGLYRPGRRPPANAGPQPFHFRSGIAGYQDRGDEAAAGLKRGSWSPSGSCTYAVPGAIESIPTQLVPDRQTEIRTLDTPTD
jgi:hypothetical protein